MRRRKGGASRPGEPPPTGTTGILPVDTYGLAPDTPEPEIVAHLFKLYAEKMKERGWGCVEA